MLYLSENIRKYRTKKNLTQEELAQYLQVSAQSVSKWERDESCPDITLLPALANIFETSVDLLLGMDTIRAEETRWQMHSEATNLQKAKRYNEAEKVYRDALRFYPNDASIILGLAGVLALQGKTEEAIEFTEKGLTGAGEKQKATMRAVLCFLYLKTGKKEKADLLAAALPHRRESREEIQPLIQKGMTAQEADAHIRYILLGCE